MEDDAPDPERRHPPPVARLSKTPSWIMLGFLLGAAFVAALPPLRKPPPEPPTVRPTPVPAPPAPRVTPVLTTIEAVFAEWGRFAVWSDQLTEVAMWNSQDRAFTDFYEVRRIDGVFYFRSIPSLTRRLISRGRPMPDSPLRFTETEEQYQEWRMHGRSEWRADALPAAPAGKE